MPLPTLVKEPVFPPEKTCLLIISEYLSVVTLTYTFFLRNMFYKLINGAMYFNFYCYQYISTTLNLQDKPEIHTHLFLLLFSFRRASFRFVSFRSVRY